MKRIATGLLVSLAVTLAACQSTPTPVTAPPGAGVGTEIGAAINPLPDGQPTAQDENLMEAQSDGQRLPRFEAAATCPFQLPQSLNASSVKCGYVVVRESRLQRNDRTLKIAVLVVKARSGSENPVANIYLQGGPGGDVQGTILSLEGGYLKTFAGANDLIIFDQRGVGNSQPRLECPAPQDAAARVQAGIARMGGGGRPSTTPADPVLEAQIQQSVTASLQCRDALRAKGYNLQAFNTFESAGDVNDIRKALGYKQLNLWGGSYGTYLAQIVMRDYRRVIRSVDLEAIIDPRQNWVALAPAAFDRSRKEIFKACAANPACAAAFPNLSQTFDMLIAELNTTQPEIDIPVSATQTIRARVNGDLFFNLLNQLLYIPEFLPLVPVFVAATKAGNYAPFGNLLGLLFVSDGTNSQGAYQSVICSDVAQFTSPARINRILDGVTQTYRRQLGAFPLSQERICREWGVRADPFATFPVISDIPTLLQVGFFDPITPPSYAEGIEDRLFNSEFVFYPAGAHGATRPSAAAGDQADCAQGILTAFYADPRAEVNAGCADQSIGFFVPDAAAMRAQSVNPFPLPKVLPASLLPRW